MNKCRIIGITLALFLCLPMLFALPGIDQVTGEPSGTRAGEIGWQYDSFEENLEMTITPQLPTTEEPIIIEIVSTIPDVEIQIANLYATIQPNGGLEFPYQSVFQRWNDTAMRCSVGPFPYDGYRITLWVIAYDWFNYNMDSRESFNNIFYDVAGSGWKHDVFNDNVMLSYSPMTVNATEEVTVTVTSKENVTFGGANLWWTYETPDGELVTGVGKNFSIKNQDVTEMKEDIMGYPAGTNVTFWVQVWDQYNVVLVSREYNYSVLGVTEYTNFPFEYVTFDEEGNFDRAEWTPTMQIILPMVGMCALGFPLFIYLYALADRREKRKEELMISNGELNNKLVSDQEGDVPD